MSWIPLLTASTVVAQEDRAKVFFRPHCSLRSFTWPILQREPGSRILCRSLWKRVGRWILQSKHQSHRGSVVWVCPALLRFRAACVAELRVHARTHTGRHTRKNANLHSTPSSRFGRLVFPSTTHAHFDPRLAQIMGFSPVSFPSAKFSAPEVKEPLMVRHWRRALKHSPSGVSNRVHLFDPFSSSHRERNHVHAVASFHLHYPLPAT